MTTTLMINLLIQQLFHRAQDRALIVRRHGADPFAYFEWVFEKLMHNPPAEQLENLLPVNWIESRPAACQTIESHVA